MPTNLRELLAFLEASPRVRIHGPTPGTKDFVTRTETFAGYEGGRLWFRPDPGQGSPHFIPVSCTLTDQAARAEAGLAFDPAGFTLTKFGVAIRVEYLGPGE